MSEDVGFTHAASPARAGFWDRLVALGIDLLLVSVLIAIVGLAATQLTGGQVRFAGTIVDVVDCTGSEPPPTGLPQVNDFEGIDARRCTRSVSGIAHDWSLVVREKAGKNERDRRQVTIPLDAQGHPVRALYLDNLITFVLAAYLFLLEWRFGTTLGKRIVAVRVHSLGGGPIDLAQAGKRALLRFIFLLSTGTPHTLVHGPDGSHRITFGLAIPHPLPDLDIWSDVLGVFALIYAISFIVTTSRGTLPLHDRWARTEAVRASRSG